MIRTLSTYSLSILLINAFVLVLITGCNSTQDISPVKVNNVGYELGQNKLGLITIADADSFEIIDIRSGKVAYSEALDQNGAYDDISGDYVLKADFSELNREGSFKLRLTNVPNGSSNVFSIEKDPYSVGALAVLRSFYIQRCGMAITQSNWERPYCHLDPAKYYHFEDLEMDVTGGWHDAGDYNKFSVTHNISIAYLLNQYLEDPEKYFDGQLNIPESGNQIPDILDEIKWGLDWLMKMQNKDGGLSHKVSIKTWTGEHLPQHEQDQQYVFEVSSTGTAGAAAVFALASGVFRKYDPEYSLMLQEKALQSWRFLEDKRYTFPLGGFRNPGDVSGGEYGDNNDTDERLWASVELYKMTGDPEFLEYFHFNYNSFWNESFYVMTWQDLRNLAYYSYMGLDPDAEGVKPKIISELQSELVDYGNTILRKTAESEYAYSLKNDEFYWGSNSVAMGYAFDLIQAYKSTGEDRFRAGALDQLHYILGRNPLGISFVTGVGSNSVQDPYHQLSKLQGVGIPVPGMLVGGANYYSHLNNKKISSFTAKNYEDRFENYMVNEPAINYTAALSYTIGYFSDLGFGINQ